MSYIINNYNREQIAIVEDGTINTSLDIKLIGKNYAGYGEAQNENFVWLLENFANATAPSKAVTGQLWFDTSTKKLKFFDSVRWRISGGSEVSATAPANLTAGDFWWDSVNSQLKAYDGAGYVLIGPQGTGAHLTQMRSRTVKATVGTGGADHAIIEAIVNDATIFVISADDAFELDSNSGITGFTVIRQGITLYNTHDALFPGETQSSHRFWGTASNADRLSGHEAGDFVLNTDLEFNTLVKFADVGFSVGLPNQRLWVYNDSSLVPTIHNKLSDTIIFKTTTGVVTNTPLKLVGLDLLPGATLTSNIGASTLKYNRIYADSMSGTADQANALNVGGTYRTASTAASSATIVARTSVDESISGVNITSGSIKANFFVGTATAAYYADLAEKYLADEEYEIGTVVMVGGVAEVTAATFGSRALGTISENPAYMMNTGLVGGTYIALKGRVPVKVSGAVKKGDHLAASSIPGVAEASTYLAAHCNLIFAIALESSEDLEVKIIEAVIL